MSSNRQWDIALGAGIGATISVVAAGFIFYKYMNKQSPGKCPFAGRLPIEHPPVTPVSVSPSASSSDSPELLLEQLSRNRQFFGDAGQDKIENAFVVCVGVGGVGSHATVMLARAGIKKIRVIDFDQVSLSSLNRHACATREDVGTSKVKAIAKFLKKVVPSCEIECVQKMFRGEDAEELLSGKPDYVLDCIDDKETKAALIMYCKTNGIPILCSLGAGGKSDPSRILFADLSYVRRDPLGASVRQYLRKLGNLPKGTSDGKDRWERSIAELTSKGADISGSKSPSGKLQNPSNENDSSTTVKGKKSTKADIDEEDSATPSGIMCVFSSEVTKVKLLPLNLQDNEKPTDFGANPQMRARIIPVLGCVPAMFGQAMASYVLCELGGVKQEPREAPEISNQATKKLQGQFVTNDVNVYSELSPLLKDGSSTLKPGVIPPFNQLKYPSPFVSAGGLSMDEVNFIVDELWRQRSPVSHVRFGSRGALFQLCRLRPWQPASMLNTLLLTDPEYRAFTNKLCVELHNLKDVDEMEQKLGEVIISLFGEDCYNTIIARINWAKQIGY